MLTGCSLGLVTKFLGLSDFHNFHLINQKHLNDEEELQDVSTAFQRMLLMLFGFATHETIKNAQAINQNFADTLSLFFCLHKLTNENIEQGEKILQGIS